MPVTPWAVTLGRTTQNLASASRKCATALSMRAVTMTVFRSSERAVFSTVPTCTSRKRTAVWPASTPAAFWKTISISGPRWE
jgi:hypothetical protein